MTTIPGRLFQRAQTHPDAPAYVVKQDGRWVTTLYAAYAAEVRQTARALLALGMEKGDTCCILGFNRPEWVLMDVGAMAVGGVPAGIYTTSSPDEVHYIVEHCDARIVLLEDEGQWAKVEQKLANLPNLAHVVMMKGATVDHPLVISWPEFLAKGDAVEMDVLDARLASLEGDDLATLIYTSGTTGPPKGVMLSVENLSWTSEIIKELLPVGPGDTNLSYLPLSHIAEQMFTIHGPISHGLTVYFAESLEAMPENLKEVQPTIVFGVPRVWEKIYAGVQAKINDAPPLKKKLVGWAGGVAQRVHQARNHGKRGGGLSYALAKRLVFEKLKPKIGLGKARFCVSGAAPISAETLTGLSGLDILIHEVYGQSEGAGPTSFNIPGATRFGSVGRAVPDVEIKIADDGEILARGKNIFLGYYKDESATGETLIDGWLHSGDLGSLDGDGFLHITGRKKEIIITAGGKNIAPKNIEGSLKNHPLISEAVIIGDRRKFLSALLCLDENEVARLLKGADGGPEAGENEAVQAAVQACIDQTNALFARVEHVRKFTVLPRMLSQEHRELTPTMKVRRKHVYENWADTIESMYTD